MPHAHEEIVTAADAVNDARDAIIRAVCPDHPYPYVPYALWLDYEAAVAVRNAEGLRDIAEKLRNAAKEAGL
jgi:hypothetical protein